MCIDKQETCFGVYIVGSMHTMVVHGSRGFSHDDKSTVRGRPETRKDSPCGCHCTAAAGSIVMRFETDTQSCIVHQYQGGQECVLTVALCSTRFAIQASGEPATLTLQGRSKKKDAGMIGRRAGES